MLSLSQIIKDLLKKKDIIITNISETHRKSQITTEITNSVTQKTGAIYIAIHNGMRTNLPPKCGWKIGEKTIPIQVPQTGLYITIPNDYDIYIGGHYVVLSKQNITLQANKDNYIYIAEDLSEVSRAKVEVYDRLLGGNDKDIHFSRFYALHAKTDSTKVTLVKTHETANYKSTLK